MKKLLSTLLLVPALLLVSFAPTGTELTNEERAKAKKVLMESQEMLMNAINGLSEGQLNFKPADSIWSIAECVEHIAIAENGIFGMVQMTLKEEANPARREEVKMTDDQIIGLIVDRTTKVKTSPEMVPSQKFGSFEGSLNEYKTKRAQNMEYVEKTKDDLRNRYFEFPFGVVDSYQIILFMAGHNNRHNKQILELKAHADFPKE